MLGLDMVHHGLNGHQPVVDLDRQPLRVPRHDMKNDQVQALLERQLAEALRELAPLALEVPLEDEEVTSLAFGPRPRSFSRCGSTASSSSFQSSIGTCWRDCP